MKDVQIIIPAGKGGVGKTTVSTSIALFLSNNGHKTALIDYDGGHSVKNTLDLKETILPNKIFEVNKNLSVVVIENTKYINITDSKAKGTDFADYLHQFPRDYGIIPFADMVSQFFGVPTDIPALQKFITLVTHIVSFKKEGYKNIVIDVEPTAGLERLLSNADTMIRSLRRLKNKGIVFLSLVGAPWPEIKKYLQSSYIKEIDSYTESIQIAVNAIKKAKFLLVCIPEFGPGDQTFDVSKIIKDFGGQPVACIINNIRGEEHEAHVINQLKMHGLPILKIPHDSVLQSTNGIRSKALSLIGENIMKGLNNQ